MTVAAAGMWVMTSCKTNDYKEFPKEEETEAHGHDHSEAKHEHQEEAAAQDTTKKAAFTVAGVVGDVANGKDGFMATITNDKGVVYSSVFSIRNLEKSYKQLKAGDHVEVTGDTMQLGDKTHIVVKQFTQQ